MLSKTPVALQTLSNSYDKLKKDTDSFLKKFKKFKKSNLDVKESENVLALSGECKSLANELESLTKEINSLENKDPKQQKNFDSKKKNLLKKVATQQKLVSDAYDIIVEQTPPEENEESKNVGNGKETERREKAAAKSRTSKKKQKEISEKQNQSKTGNDNNSSKKDSQSGSNVSGENITGNPEKETSEDICEDVDEHDESDDDVEEDDDDDDDDDDTEEDGDDEEKEEGVASTSGPASNTSIAVTENEDAGKVKSFKRSHSSSKAKSKILNQKSESEKSSSQIVPIPDPDEGQTAAEAATTESQSSGTNQKRKGLKSKLIADVKSVLKHNLRHKEKLPSKTKELLEEKEEGKKDLVEEEVEEESDEYDDETEEEEEEVDKVDEEEEDSTNEEDDDDDEVEESDEEMELPTKHFVALSNYEKEEITDLSFKKGEVLKIVKAHRNGWWLAENNDGFQGLVPSTYLQMRSTMDDDDDEEEEEDEEEGSAEESRKDEGESDSDDNFEEEEEEKEKENEEEDSDVEEDVKVDSGGDKPETRSAKQLWQTIKESIQEQSVVDVLQAKGTVPSGFRPSTLSNLWVANSEYRMEKVLHPSLSKTAMSYTDLFYSPSDKQICPYSVNILKIVSIQSCRNIPQTGPGIDVQCRCIRVCIFDGKNVLSNIHTIKVQSVDKSQRSWNFSSRVSDNMDVSLHTEFFVRTNYSGNQINLLFELCLSYTQQDTQEQGIFSCGWTKLLLSEEAITNRTYELPLHGGTPYDRGIPLDSRFSNAVEENSFLSLFTGHQKPTLLVKVSPPKKEQKDVLNSLPHTIIGNVCLMHFYALYRNILAKALLRDRTDSDNTELISSSVLASFPLIADQFDMMQLLRDTWIEKQKEMSRTARRDSNNHKKLFIDSFLETVYPFSHILIPGMTTTGIDTNQKQYDAIQKFKDLKSERGSTLAILLSGDFTYEPMKLNEVTFSVLKDNGPTNEV